MRFLAHLSWKLKWAILIACCLSSVCPSICLQGSKLTSVCQSVTDKNPGGQIDFFTYQSDLAHSDWSMYFKILEKKKQPNINQHFLFSGKSPIWFIGFCVIKVFVILVCITLLTLALLKQWWNRKRGGQHHTLPRSLVDLVLCLPTASSDAERRFLELKMTTTYR
jgi:hypothetical protein